MKPLTVCITYDENFEPMCSQLCLNISIDGIKIKLNKTESKEDYRVGFHSSNWYMNLSEKMLFARRSMDQIDYGDILCVSDADIQVFRPQDLLDKKIAMESSEIEYMGQRERDEDFFNGGFFLIKKNDKMINFLDAINSEDLTLYKYAEQDVINKLIPSMAVNHRFLSRTKYLNGCMRFNPYVSPNLADKIVMHHATCSYNANQKMEQMNLVRSLIGLHPIDWSTHTGIIQCRHTK